MVANYCFASSNLCKHPVCRQRAKFGVSNNSAFSPANLVLSNGNGAANSPTLCVFPACCVSLHSFVFSLFGVQLFFTK